VPEQAHGTLAGRVRGLYEGQVGTRLPDIAALRAEQPARLTRALAGIGRVARCQRRGSGREEQLRLLVGDAPLRRYLIERGIGLPRRFTGQPGGQQRRAAVEGKFEAGPP
jgi:hypothetical protein